MGALLIIPLLISGFIVITRHPYHFYRLHRYDGQLLYMKAAVYGFYCMATVVSLALVMKHFAESFHPVGLVAQVGEFSDNKSENRLYSWMIVISGFSVLAGIAWAYGARLWYLIRFAQRISSGAMKCDTKELYNHLKLSVLAPLLSELPVNKLFFESLMHRKPILITMKSTKVYVGIVSRISEPNETDAPNQEVTVIPLMSGYRDKKQQIHFINKYEDLSGVDTGISLPRCEICHTSWFTYEVHERVDNSAVLTPEAA